MAPRPSRERPGRLAAHIDPTGRAGAVVAVTCQSELAAGSLAFAVFATRLCERVVAEGVGEPGGARALAWGSAQTVAEAEVAISQELGEAVCIDRIARQSNPSGRVMAWVHDDLRHAAIVSVDTGAASADARPVLVDLCRRVVWLDPRVPEPGDIGLVWSAGLNAPRGPADTVLAVAGRPWVPEEITVGEVLARELGPGSRLVDVARVELRPE